MASRFTDTEKWQDGWFSDLQPFEKLLFNYLCDNCDCAGFMEVSKRKIANDIGFSMEDCEGAFKGLSRGLEWGSDGYVVFVKNFLKRQKNLPVNPKNLQHKGIIKRFSLYVNKFDFQALSKILNQNILSLIPNVQSPLEGAKDMVKVMVKVEEEGGVGETLKNILKDFGFNEIANPDKLRILSDFIFIQESNGRLEYFLQQYTAYMQFKTLSGENKHNFGTFLGKQEEQFEDGKWKDANWELKLSEYQSKNGNTKNTNGFNNRESRQESVDNLRAAARAVLTGRQS